jgi:hypothetical protein
MSSNVVVWMVIPVPAFWILLFPSVFIRPATAGSVVKYFLKLKGMTKPDEA